MSYPSMSRYFSSCFLFFYGLSACLALMTGGLVRWLLAH